MANYFEDNEDIQFLFDHLDLASVAEVQEKGFTLTDGPGSEYAPVDAADAIDNYRRILTTLGEVAAERIAPRAEKVDKEGNTLNPDGTVTLGEGVRANLDVLAQADMMAFTIPRQYGGLNCPNLVYTMGVEMVSRADASLMNLWGLQGIAETIEAFASQDIKDDYLPRFAAGELTGAMVLTEPDAGSDLQAVNLKATQDENGNWVLNGVKRFITNGCGEVLLTMARSEPDTKDGRGLSLFLVDRGPHIRIRHLEDKLGIHGSPTCEMVYDNAPGVLVGERQLGLIRYVMALMNGARVGIAGQSLGIAEAAYRVARDYANKRKQFGKSIEQLPAVAELVVDMKIAVEVGRALTYETCTICDYENNNQRVLEGGDPIDKDEQKERKKNARLYKRLNGMLTPMSKYYCSEMCNRVTYDALQVLGGSGYMKDYPIERLVRDARITTIYEGTSQLQIVAAVRGVCSEAFDKEVDRCRDAEYPDELKPLAELLEEAQKLVHDGVAKVKAEGGMYMDLHGRKLVDAAIMVIVGYLFLRQAKDNQRKVSVARRYITNGLPKIRSDIAVILSGDKSAMEEYELLAGPVPDLA